MQMTLHYILSLILLLSSYYHSGIKFRLLRNGLKQTVCLRPLTVSKTKYMIFGTGQRLRNLSDFTLFMGGDILEKVGT